MGVGDFTELRVYRLAFDSAMRVFRCSAQWPKEERYSLTDQIRRSSRSTAGALAEAWAKRRYPAHFASKLTDALAECRETRVWLDFARECGYLGVDEHQGLKSDYDRIGQMLNRMVSQPSTWNGPRRVREEER
jgi:four helix bundle protein